MVISDSMNSISGPIVFGEVERKLSPSHDLTQFTSESLNLHKVRVIRKLYFDVVLVPSRVWSFWKLDQDFAYKRKCTQNLVENTS